MRFRLTFLFLLLGALIPANSRAASPITSTQSAPLCFSVPGVLDCIDQKLSDYWQHNGGLPVFGYPLGAALPEQTADGLWTAQHFERNRLELHPDTPAPFNVQLGRLGADRLQQLGRIWQTEPAGKPTTGCHFFSETKHAVCEPFLSYWRTHGLEFGDPGVSDREALALWGLPLTEPRVERNSSGDEVVTQWFERARFENHGSVGVLLGRLGAEVDVASQPQSPAAGWVTIQGDHLVQNGQTVRLKGVNYYTPAHPWSFTWTHWDGPQVDRDLGRMERELGANVVRVLVPYHFKDGWTDNKGHLQPGMLDRLRQFVQLAGNHRIKVIITLFDWHGMLEPKARGYESSYLQAIVGAFRDDDRVLAWDLHNEPDHYSDWNVDAAGVVSWLASIAGEIRSLDPRHPITVGVGKAPALWQPARDGRTLLDIVDLVSVHGYDANQYQSMLQTIRQRTAKPILLEEFGWPSGPECMLAFHDEPSQLFLFQKAITALDQPGVVGGLSWWLQDSPISEWFPTQDENAFFGVYRVDGSAKPALAVLRGWPVAALPSAAVTNLPITVTPPPVITERYRAIRYDDLIIHGSFKFFWLFFGGESRFGKPITQAYRDQNGKLVQYFERARFELNESEHVKPIDPDWPEGQTDEVYLDRVHLTPLGTQLTADRAFPAVSNPQQPDVIFVAATGHTIRGIFRDLWLQHGAPFWGQPISEELTETIDGQPRTVQYFEKWRMERLADGTIQLANLGQTALAQRPCVRGW